LWNGTGFGLGFGSQKSLSRLLKAAFLLSV
jgi:hypothetical protein